MKGPKSLEQVRCPAASMGSGPVGEGEFSLAEDKTKLAPLLLPMLRRALRRYLQDQDFVGFRLLLNEQSVYLRELGVEEFCKPVPSSASSGSRVQSFVVEEFLHQNGFSSVCERDSGGWLPLHYAALSGDEQVVQGLLARRANPNQKTTKDQQHLGLPRLVSALAISSFFRHHDAMQVLISARAKLTSSKATLTPLIAAAVANSPEAVRRLCDARCSPHHRNLLGSTAFEVACAHNSTEAMEELYLQTGGRGIDMSLTLHCAIMHHGGTAPVVQRLVEWKADVNDQSFTWWKLGVRLVLVAKHQALQYRDLAT